MSIFSHRLPFSAALLISFCAATGCAPPKKPGSESGELSADPGNASSEFSDDDQKLLAEFGEAYARAITEGDDAVAQESWNVNATLNLALGDSEEQAPEFVQELKRGAVESIEEKPGGILSTTFGEPCRMLRVHEVEGETRILCRIAGAAGVSYYDLIPQTNAGGKLEFNDMYSFGAGEKLSETFRRLILPQIAEEIKTPIEKLLTTPDPMVKHTQEIAALSRIVRTGNFEQALESYQALPAEIQTNKGVLLIYLRTAGKLMATDENQEAEKAYRDAVTQFEKLYGDDPAFLLMGIDYYFYQEDFAAAAKAINKLDKAVGGDPYLDFFRASMMMSQEKYEEALPLAQQAIENDPDIEDPSWGIVNIQLALGDFGAVAKGLDQLVERFGYEFELKEDSSYDELRLSPAGKAWMETYEAR